jgi:hypothetical protein
MRLRVRTMHIHVNPHASTRIHVHPHVGAHAQIIYFRQVTRKVVDALRAPINLVSAVAKAIDERHPTLEVHLSVAVEHVHRVGERHDIRGSSRQNEQMSATCDEEFVKCLGYLASEFHVTVYRERGSYICYSVKESAKHPLSTIPKPPHKLLPICNGYRLVRHDRLVAVARPDGCCMAEAVAFAVGDAAVGDRVQSVLQASPTSLTKMSQLAHLLQPQHQLRHVECLSKTLTFVDLVRTHSSQGVFLCLVNARDGGGTCVPHMVVYDAWRHIIFLGAGEMDGEWIAGILGICGNDLRGSNLDDRLRDELRIETLLDVRVVYEHVPSTRQKLSTKERRSAKKRKHEDL